MEELRLILKIKAKGVKARRRVKGAKVIIETEVKGEATLVRLIIGAKVGI